MEKTNNYNLKKPNETDEVLIGDMNANADIIDAELKKLDTEIKSTDSRKVDKISGKGLSSNDFTAEYLNKINNTEQTLTNHRVDNHIHVTQLDKDKWNNIQSSQNFIRNGRFNVSQRGYDYTTGKSDRIFADGWHCINSNVATKIPDGINLSDTNTLLQCYQGLETKDVEILSGKTVTASALVKYIGNSEVIAMSIYSWQGKPSARPPETGNKYYYSQVTKENAFQELRLTFDIPVEHNAMLIKIGANSSGILGIKNVKLEIGSEATLYEPLSYGEELLKCQRYYQQYANGYDKAVKSTSFLNRAVGAFSIPKMRVIPKITTQSIQLYGSTGLISVNYDGAPYSTDNYVNLWFYNPSYTTLPEGYLMNKATDGTGGIFLDAEIY